MSLPLPFLFFPMRFPPSVSFFSCFLLLKNVSLLFSSGFFFSLKQNGTSDWYKKGTGPLRRRKGGRGLRSPGPAAATPATRPHGQPIGLGRNRPAERQRKTPPHCPSLVRVVFPSFLFFLERRRSSVIPAFSFRCVQTRPVATFGHNSKLNNWVY